MPQSTRWGIRYPAGTDVPDVPLWMSRMAADLDDVAKDTQGTFASRPTSSVGTPGKAGRFYTATDLQSSPTLRDFGTGWRGINEAYGTYAQRPAAATDLEGLMYYATDKWMRFLCTAGAWVLIEAIPQPVASIPTNASGPVDGQRISLPIGTARGVFRYNAGSGNAAKWESEGSAWIYDYIAAATGSLTTAYAATTVPGPSLAIPFPGDWLIRLSAWAAAGQQGQSVNMSMAGAGVAAGDGDSAIQASQSTAGTGNYYAVHAERLKTGMTAGTLTAQYKSSVAGSGAIQQRTMSALPIRLAGS